MDREAAHPGIAWTASDILSITIRQGVILSLIYVTRAGYTGLIHHTMRAPVRLAFPLLRGTVGLCIPLSPGKDLVMPMDIQTMLVATDLSDASAPATAYAFSLARALNARLYILHVVPEDDVRVLTAIRSYLQSEVTPAALVETFYTEADKRLTALVGEAGAADLVQERLIVTGQPATAI